MDRVGKEVRSRIMAAIRSKNTSLEKVIFEGLRKKKICFQKHNSHILGSPDISIPSKNKVVFIDGDFWHGYRFPAWEKRLNNHWRKKIQRNRRRDCSYHKRLKRSGWKVMRVWEHQVLDSTIETIDRVANFLRCA